MELTASGEGLSYGGKTFIAVAGQESTAIADIYLLRCVQLQTPVHRDSEIR